MPTHVSALFGPGGMISAWTWGELWKPFNEYAPNLRERTRNSIDLVGLFQKRSGVPGIQQLMCETAPTTSEPVTGVTRGYCFRTLKHTGG